MRVISVSVLRGGGGALLFTGGSPHARMHVTTQTQYAPLRMANCLCNRDWWQVVTDNPESQPSLIIR